MENINGINVNVSEVLADKIAELALVNITEEQLKDYARHACNEVVTKKYSYGSSNPSKAETKAAEIFYSKVSEKVEEIINSEEYQEKVKEEAELIIKEMREKMHEQLVTKIVDQLSGAVVNPYGGVFKANVEQIVMQMMNNRY